MSSSKEISSKKSSFLHCTGIPFSIFPGPDPSKEKEGTLQIPNEVKDRQVQELPVSLHPRGRDFEYKYLKQKVNSAAIDYYCH